MGSPPDVTNISPQLWADLEKDQEDCLASVLLLAYIAAGTGLGLTVGLKSGDIDDLEGRGKIWSEDVSRDVSRRMTETTRQRLEVVSGRQRAGEATAQDVDDVIVSTTSDSRADGVATTETTRVQTAGETDAATTANDRDRREAGSGPGAGKKSLRLLVAKWVHRPPISAPGIPGVHPCPVCLPLIGLTADKWPTQFASGPPAHPGGDCFLEWIPGDPKKAVLRNPLTGIPRDLVR